MRYIKTILLIKPIHHLSRKYILTFENIQNTKFKVKHHIINKQFLKWNCGR